MPDEQDAPRDVPAAPRDVPGPQEIPAPRDVPGPRDASVPQESPAPEDVSNGQPGVLSAPEDVPGPRGVPSTRGDVPPVVVPSGQPGTPPPPPAAREVLAAGFAHRDREEGARGFAAGGPLDTMEPGSALAAAAVAATAAGLAALDDDELVGLLCAARRLTSWAASVELRAVSGLAGRRTAHAAATGSSRQAEHVADEVAAALTLTCRSADRLLNLAAALARLPAASAALAAGRIDMPKAIAFTEELAGLGDVPAAAVAAVAAPDAAGLTTSELRRLLRRTVLALDPDAAVKRREKAQKEARVECWADPSGAWSLAGRDLPPAEVLAADQKIDADARDLKAAGAEGTLEYLRSRVFLARLNEQPLSTLLPGQDQDGGPGGAGRDGDDRDGDDPWQGPGGSPRPGPAGPRGGPGLTAGLTGSVNLTIPLTAWLGLTGQPGEAAGYGPLDAAACRDLTAALASVPGSRWCVTITSPRGAALGHGCAKAGNHPPLGSTAPPGGPASSGARPPGTGPPGTGPPGARSPGARSPGERARPGSTGPPGAPGQIPWLAGITIRWLETGACGHARETLAYQPSPSLRHLIKTRDQTCSFPGCRRPARRCDDDHTQPFDQGGRTCECNLTPLCRRHHAAKQAPGWHLHQPAPGTLTWNFPSGRTRTVTPPPYAA